MQHSLTGSQGDCEARRVSAQVSGGGPAEPRRSDVAAVVDATDALATGAAAAGARVSLLLQLLLMKMLMLVVVHSSSLLLLLLSSSSLWLTMMITVVAAKGRWCPCRCSGRRRRLRSIGVAAPVAGDLQPYVHASWDRR